MWGSTLARTPGDRHSGEKSGKEMKGGDLGRGDHSFFPTPCHCFWAICTGMILEWICPVLEGDRVLTQSHISLGTSNNHPYFLIYVSTRNLPNLANDSCGMAHFFANSMFPSGWSVAHPSLSAFQCLPKRPHRACELRLGKRPSTEAPQCSLARLRFLGFQVVKVDLCWWWNGQLVVGFRQLDMSPSTSSFGSDNLNFIICNETARKVGSCLLLVPSGKLT